jgi:hypothetical protein
VLPAILTLRPNFVDGGYYGDNEDDYYYRRHRFHHQFDSNEEAMSIIEEATSIVDCKC